MRRRRQQTSCNECWTLRLEWSPTRRSASEACHGFLTLNCFGSMYECELHTSFTCCHGELRPNNGWELFASLGQTSKFLWVSRLGSVTARYSSNGRQPNFAALSRWRHLLLAHWVLWRKSITMSDVRLSSQPDNFPAKLRAPNYIVWWWQSDKRVNIVRRLFRQQLSCDTTNIKRCGELISCLFVNLLR